MASEKRGARSAAIRQYLSEHPDAKPKEIVDGLKQAGVEVGVNLVSSIKYGKRSKKATVKAGRRGRAKVSGSEAIRRLLTKNPEAGPKAIRAKLAKKGINVSAGLISFVKFNFKKAGKAPSVRVAARRTAVRRAIAGSVSFDQLLAVKRVADSMGGAAQLRQALDMLAQLS
ncbi:MAG: hypothetical protein HY290_07320 [Planctomycetia bacterium]|nr:hypothetical protein [Planctomycetia bacterium]